MITKIDITRDFFELYPNLKIAFKDILRANTNRPQLSKIMWAIALLFHPVSDYYELPFERRVEHVLNKYLKYKGNFEAFQDKYGNTIDLFKEMCMTKAQRALVNWEKKLEERDKFIEAIPYGAETYDMLDQMMAKSEKMWAQYGKVLEAFQKEQENIKNKGGVTLSPVDEGLI